MTSCSMSIRGFPFFGVGSAAWPLLGRLRERAVTPNEVDKDAPPVADRATHRYLHDAGTIRGWRHVKSTLPQQVREGGALFLPRLAGVDASCRVDHIRGLKRGVATWRP